MEYRKFGNTYMIRMDRGEEVVQSLRDFCVAQKVTLGSVSAIGACDYVRVGCYDVAEQQYHVSELEGAFEITSLLGNITTNHGEVYLHLHITLADDCQKAYGGHLNECRISGTCEMFVQVLEGTVERQGDVKGKTGLNIFAFED